MERNLDFSLINRLVIWSAVGEALTKLLHTAQDLKSGSASLIDSLAIPDFLASAVKLTLFMGIGDANYQRKNNLEQCSACGKSDMIQPHVYLDGL